MPGGNRAHCPRFKAERGEYRVGGRIEGQGRHPGLCQKPLWAGGVGEDRGCLSPPSSHEPIIFCNYLEKIN